VKRKIVSIVIILGLLVGLTAIPAQAATEEEVKDAIDSGVAWLLAQQDVDPDSPGYGSWGHLEPVAVTAFAVKKLEHHAVDTKWGLGLDSPFDAPYAAQLQAGLDFLFANATVIAIDTQTHDGTIDDPDTDGDGKGVYFGIGIWNRTYTTGIALMAIAESTTPDRVVDVPGSEVDGWTYEEVAQDTVDYLAWGQTDSGNGRGGWDYQENSPSNQSDQSNTGYAVLGLQYAEASPPEGFALTIPPFVKTELEIWVDYIQEPDGGSDYYAWDISNILRTGNLLKELAFIGATETDARVQNALGYLHLNWDELGEPGWRGWSGGVANYQATYTTMKGLTSLNIHEFGDPPIDWQADFETVLVEQQNTEDPDDPLYGSWPRMTFWDVDPPILSTLWALLTLQKVAPPPPCPEEPGTRTLGFYKNHPCVVEELLPQTVGESTFDMIEQAMELLWAKPRGDHSLILERALLVAKFNVAMFGIGPCDLLGIGKSVNKIIAQGEELLANLEATKDELSAKYELLDEINNYGTDVPLPEEIAEKCPPGGGPPKPPPGKGKNK